jgi:hypothetical protein
LTGATAADEGAVADHVVAADDNVANRAADLESLVRGVVARMVKFGGT